MNSALDSVRASRSPRAMASALAALSAATQALKDATNASLLMALGGV